MAGWDAYCTQLTAQGLTSAIIFGKDGGSIWGKHGSPIPTVRLSAVVELGHPYTLLVLPGEVIGNLICYTRS